MMEVNDSAQEAQTNDTDVDALLESIELPQDKQEPPAQPIQPKVEEYSFIHNGKEVKGDIEKLKRWAQQGYDAPNRLGELNKKINEFAQREAQLKELEQKYKPVNEFVQKNPELYQRLYSEYEKQQALIPSAVIDPLRGEIENLKQGFQTLEQERMAERMRQEDEVYQKELSDIKKTYPKVDFDSKDESGKSLEHRVLQYAVDNGIKKFTTAFRDFYHDNILKMTEESAKEKAVASKQKMTRQGILDVTSYPSRKPSTDYNKSKSWNDVLKEAIDEYT